MRNFLFARKLLAVTRPSRLRRVPIRTSTTTCEQSPSSSVSSRGPVVAHLLRKKTNRSPAALVQDVHRQRVDLHLHVRAPEEARVPRVRRRKGRRRARPRDEPPGLDRLAPRAAGHVRRTAHSFLPSLLGSMRRRLPQGASARTANRRRTDLFSALTDPPPLSLSLPSTRSPSVSTPSLVVSLTSPSPSSSPSVSPSPSRSTSSSPTLALPNPHRQIRRPSLRTATKSLYLQAPPQLEQATRPNLALTLGELLAVDGEAAGAAGGGEVTVTDASMPFSLGLRVVFK